MCLYRLREGVRKMEEKHFSEHNDEHVEFLPVEWRSKLALDGGQYLLSILVYICTVITVKTGDLLLATLL